MDKKYIYVNNPTQVNNYGTSENSVQTISRKTKEIFNEPENSISKLAHFINYAFVCIMKGLWLALKITIIPFIVILISGLFIFHLSYHPEPNITTFSNNLWFMINDLLSNKLFEFIRIIWPLIIIATLGLTYIYWTSYKLSNHIYKNNKAEARAATKAMVIAQAAFFLKNLGPRR